MDDYLIQVAVEAGALYSFIRRLAQEAAELTR